MCLVGVFEHYHLTNINLEQTKYSRVPSKRVAMVSRNVFWGANSPFRAGIEIDGRLYRRSLL